MECPKNIDWDPNIYTNPQKMIFKNDIPVLMRFDVSISTWGSKKKDIVRRRPATPQATCCQRATHHSAAQGCSWGDP